MGVQARDRAGAVVRVQHPHPVVRNSDFGRCIAYLDNRGHVERGRIDDADRVRGRLEGCSTIDGEREDGADRRHAEQHSAGNQQAPTDATPTFPNRARRRPETERCSRCVDERGAVRVAIRRLLGERPSEDWIQGVVARGGGLVVHVSPQGLRLRRPPERRTADEELVQDAGERILVGAPVRVPLTDLLRSEVVERSGEARSDRAPLTEPLGQAEVAEVAVIDPVDEDVSGLDVPVHEPALVRRVERVRHLTDQPQRTHRLERPVLQHRP